MSTPAVSTGKLRALARWASIFLLLIALIWAVVIYWWQATQRVVTGWDIALFLVALPCLALAGIALAKRRAGRSAPMSAQAAPAAAAAPSSAPPAPLPRLMLPILNAWAVAGGAASVEQLAQALAERRMRPRPDPELSDEDGFPLLSARVDGLDTTPAAQWLMRASPLPGDTLEWRAAFLRSLALLDMLADQLEYGWAMLTDAMERHGAAYDENGATLRGAPARPAPAAPFQLDVALIAPAAFSRRERQLALDYLSELLPLPAAANRNVELVAASDGSAAFALLDSFRRRSQEGDSPQFLLLLACDSALCPSVLENWQSAARLFGTRCQNGLMAGEGAFAVLCANDAALSALAAPPACYLAGAAFRMREDSADTHGKPSHAALDDAVRETLRDAGVPSGAIGTVVCDADHRPDRILECCGAMTNHAPHLDAIRNRLAVNEACGHLGAASALGVLSAAVQRTLETQHPVLLCSVSHATERAAAILLPAHDA